MNPETINKLQEHYALKEPWITIIAMVTVLGTILVTGLILFRAEAPTRPALQDPDVSKSQIEIIKEQNLIEELEKDKLLRLYNSLYKIDVYPGGLVTPISLVQACKDGEKNQQLCNEEIVKITKVINIFSDLSDAYLYIRAATSRGGAPLGNLTENDSLYLYVDSAKDYGGHLLRSRAQWSRINIDSAEFIFDLKAVPFTKLPYNDFAEPDQVINLLEILNTGDKHFIGSFVSTLGYGKLIEMKIGYGGGSFEINK